MRKNKMKKNEYGWPSSIVEIRKYIKSLGYTLEIRCEFGDLVGATIRWPKEFYVNLNYWGKYSIDVKGKKEAYLAAAQKAYWFVKTFLKPIKSA